MEQIAPKKHRIYGTSFASVYPCYIAKAEKKGRTKKEVDTIICWLTSYTEEELLKTISEQISFEDFFANAPLLNPLRNDIKGSICGVKIQEITDPLMKEIRYLDKLIDDLAKGKSIEKIIQV